MLILVKKVTKKVAPNIGRRQAGHIAAKKPIAKPVLADFFVLHFQKEQFPKRRPPANGNKAKIIQSIVLKDENATTTPNIIISIRFPLGNPLDHNAKSIENEKYKKVIITVDKINILKVFLFFKHIKTLKKSILYDHL